MCRHLRLGQHDRAGRSAVRDRRPGGQGPARRHAQRRGLDLRGGAPAPEHAARHRRRHRRRVRRPHRLRPGRHVGPTFGAPDEVAGIYRVRRDGTGVPVADIGAWSVANPPDTDFVLKAGVQYAMEPFRGGFAVTDGHHNRVVYARRDGEVRELLALDNVVPTGLAAVGRTLFMGLAGAVPHLPEDGKVVAIARPPRRGGDRVRRATGRRRGARSRSPAVRALAGHLAPAGQPRLTGSADTGSLTRVDTRPAHARGWTARPPDLGRVLPRERVRGHPHGQGHEDRRHRAPPLVRSRARMPALSGWPGAATGGTMRPCTGGSR